jgi:hypothetical protein
MPKKTDSQVERFRKAAREHEADEDESKFNDALGRVAKASVPRSNDTANKPVRSK